MKKTILFFTATIISATFISCTTLKEIPEDKTPAQILQMGQDAYALGNYKNAEFCFNTTIERFGSNPATYAEARYELAHAYSKQKKYDKAYEIYTELIDLYDSNIGIFPPTYKKLCQIGINNIPEAKLNMLRASEESNN